jgi:hypothetical protein
MENNGEPSVIWIIFAGSCHITLLYQRELKPSDNLQQYRVTINVQSNLLMSKRIFIPIQNKKTNRLSICKFINRYRITRHLLHSGTLSLHFIAQSNLRNHSRMHSMILSIHGTYHKPRMTKRQIYSHRSKYNSLSTTFSSIICLLSHEYNPAVCIT